MLFNSIQFLIFFVVVTVLFYLLPHKFRWLLLLLASCYFYMAFVPVYILILGFTIVIDYFAGLYIEKSTGHKRKLFLVISLIANIGVLCVFKYYNFINANITSVLSVWNYSNPFPYLAILLPIGLSFHTFQAMSYTIEVYRGNQPAERKFGIYALYVMFYPQLVAGPIERPQNLLHQFYEKHSFNAAGVSEGLQQMLIGFLKKLVIADRVAIYVNTIYNNSNSQSGKSLACAAIFFAFQIYCDFSAYSDIAIGAAKTMGFKLMTNFNMPFFSKGITDFWRRWHISLSTWFNDYLFTPLVIANRDWGKFAVVFALIITFFISGLWHGAGWNFVIFGMLHGLAMVYEFLTKKFRKKMAKAIPAFLYNNLSILLTFLFASFTWIFFRIPTIGDAISIIKKIIKFDGPFYLGNPKDHFYYACVAILLLMFFEIIKEYKPGFYKFLPNNLVARFSYYTLLVVIIMLFGVFGGGQFIYFQF